MGHDANEVLLGTTQSSFKQVDNYNGSIPAGKIVRLKSDGTISLLEADGAPLGISLGIDLSDIGRTAVVRRGTRVPVLLTSAFNPVVGTQVHIDDETGIAKASGSGVSGVNAVYATGRLTTGAIDESGNTGVGVALIDFPGGL
jgi:hypothetical protein